MDGQRDGGLVVLPVAPLFSEAALPCGGFEGLFIVNQGEYLTLQPERLLIGVLQFCWGGAAVPQQIPLNGLQGFLDVDKNKISPPPHDSHPGTYGRSPCLLLEYAVHI